MVDLGLLPLINGANTALVRSALPDSPVVPDRPPGRVRLRTAGALHRLAARLDPGVPPPRYGRPA